MRYDSLLNSKKWPSDSSKGSATSCFLPSLSVMLSCLVPNHHFSTLDFSGLGQSVFLKFDFAVFKWSKFNNLPTFSKSITDWIHFRPHQTLCYFLAFWVLWPQPCDFYILGYHSFTSWRIANYHISFERGYLELSYDIRIFRNMLKVTKIQTKAEVKVDGPRTFIVWLWFQTMWAQFTLPVVSATSRAKDVMPSICNPST